jgi:hypothetical protein
MTGRALLDPQAREHLCKLLGMLGSDHDGEIAAAGRKAHAHIKKLGLTWADVIYFPPASWREMANVCAKHQYTLNEREADFIRNILRLRGAPSDKQLRWLENIFARFDAHEAAA